MNFTTALARLDDLIVKHTTGTVTATLRGRLFTIREHAEAFEKDRLKLRNTHTVFKNQAEDTIANLHEEKDKVTTENAELKEEINRIKDKNAVLTKENTDLREMKRKINALNLRAKLGSGLPTAYLAALGIKSPKI